MVVSLPPVHLIAAGLDPLLDDSVEFALRLKRLGVPFHLKVFEKVRTGMYCVCVCVEYLVVVNKVSCVQTGGILSVHTHTHTHALSHSLARSHRCHMDS